MRSIARWPCLLTAVCLFALCEAATAQNNLLEVPSTYTGTTKTRDYMWALEIKEQKSPSEYSGELRAQRSGQQDVFQDVSIKISGEEIRITGSNVRGSSRWRPDVFKMVKNGDRLEGVTFDANGGNRETIFVRQK